MSRKLRFSLLAATLAFWFAGQAFSASYEAAFGPSQCLTCSEGKFFQYSSVPEFAEDSGAPCQDVSVSDPVSGLSACAKWQERRFQDMSVSSGTGWLYEFLSPAWSIESKPREQAVLNVPKTVPLETSGHLLNEAAMGPFSEMASAYFKDSAYARRLRPKFSYAKYEGLQKNNRDYALGTNFDVSQNSPDDAWLKANAEKYGFLPRNLNCQNAAPGEYRFVGVGFAREFRTYEKLSWTSACLSDWLSAKRDAIGSFDGEYDPLSFSHFEESRAEPWRFFRVGGYVFDGASVAASKVSANDVFRAYGIDVDAKTSFWNAETVWAFRFPSDPGARSEPLLQTLYADRLGKALSNPGAVLVRDGLSLAVVKSASVSGTASKMNRSDLPCEFATASADAVPRFKEGTKFSVVDGGNEFEVPAEVSKGGGKDAWNCYQLPFPWVSTDVPAVFFVRKSDVRTSTFSDVASKPPVPLEFSKTSFGRIAEIGKDEYGVVLPFSPETAFLAWNDPFSNGDRNSVVKNMAGETAILVRTVKKDGNPFAQDSKFDYIPESGNDLSGKGPASLAKIGDASVTLTKKSFVATTGSWKYEFDGNFFRPASGTGTKTGTGTANAEPRGGDVPPWAYFVYAAVAVGLLNVGYLFRKGLLSAVAWAFGIVAGTVSYLAESFARWRRRLPAKPKLFKDMYDTKTNREWRAARAEVLKTVTKAKAALARLEAEETRISAELAAATESRKEAETSVSELNASLKEVDSKFRKILEDERSRIERIETLRKEKEAIEEAARAEAMKKEAEAADIEKTIAF